MPMSPSCKQYVHQQDILMHMSVMHILTLWSLADFERDEPKKTGLDNTGTSTKHSKNRKPQEYQDLDDMKRVST